MEFLSLITTPSYAPGAVCLAQSLALCGSKATLRVIATTKETELALLQEFANCASEVRFKVELIETKLPEHEGDNPTHGAKGASLSVDAPRRILFGKDCKPFILLDADLLAVQNPDRFLQFNDDNTQMRATANFRIKKQCFGPVTGNFNAGVMVVPKPECADGEMLESLVAEATEEDTEELLLNRIFRNRWSELPYGLNVPKRVMHHAPEVWNSLLDGGELVFVHYMGAKPWQLDLTKRAGADWEAERPAYLELEKLWWKVSRGEIKAVNDGGNILKHVPRG